MYMLMTHGANMKITFANSVEFLDFRFWRCEFMKRSRFYAHNVPEYIYLYEADSRSAIQ